MYPHESHQTQEEEPLSLSLNYPDLSLKGSHEFPFNLKHEPLNSLHCFDPSAILSSPSVLRLLIPQDFHSSSEMTSFPGDLSAAAESASTVFYDPAGAVHLGLADQNASFNSVLHDQYGFCYGGVFEERYRGEVEMATKKKGRKKMEAPAVEKHEKQRRERLSKKFDVLKALIPNSTKPDRASVVAGTIDYINELLRTVDELKTLVDKKRRRRERCKLLEIGEELSRDTESSSMLPLTAADNQSKRSLRIQWIQRRSKETLVDVRIMEEEATIKLTHRRNMNSMLAVSKILDELQLELLHLSGGDIGDYHVFLFNTKIHEGSSIYAGAIAKKLIEAMDLPLAPYACSNEFRV